MAWTLSWLICAVPVSSTDLPAGPGNLVQPAQLGLRAVGEQRSRAADGEKCAALCRPGGAEGGPTRARQRRCRRGRDRRHVRHPGQIRCIAAQISAGRPWASGMTTLTAVAESSAKSLRNWSPTWRAEAECGSTRSSGKPHRTPRNGVPNSISSVTTASPIGTARRITNLVERYQNSCSTGRATGSGRPRRRRTSRRTSSAFSRSPEQHDGRRRHHDRRDRGEGDGGDTAHSRTTSGSASGTGSSRPSTARPSSPRTTRCVPRSPWCGSAPRRGAAPSAISSRNRLTMSKV